MEPDFLDIESPVFWARLGTAILCGATIGIERQLRGKASGVRTSILVCLGTAMFVALGESLTPAGSPDRSRVLGQVITGIGFLGAGVILARDGRVLGVTSAAVIWMLAALGALIGAGHLATAMVLTLTTLAILIGIEAVETAWTRLRQGSREAKLEHIELE
jgi:putative Mg2+ transporter-C (MgtC) family protein